MSKYKSLFKIPNNLCFRKSSKYITHINPFQLQKLRESTVFCDIFCKDVCISELNDSCLETPVGFCKTYCKEGCYKIGVLKTPST